MSNPDRLAAIRRPAQPLAVDEARLEPEIRVRIRRYEVTLGKPFVSWTVKDMSTFLRRVS